MTGNWDHFNCSICGQFVKGYGAKEWITWPKTNFGDNYEPEICHDCFEKLKHKEAILYFYDRDSPLTEFYVWKGFDQFIRDNIMMLSNRGLTFDVNEFKKSHVKQIEHGVFKIREKKSPNYLVCYSYDLFLFAEIDLPVWKSEEYE